MVTLFGVRSGLFIAMSDRGKLYGSVRVYAEAIPDELLWKTKVIIQLCVFGSSLHMMTCGMKM